MPATMLFFFLTVLAFIGCSSAQTLDDCPAGLDRDDTLKLFGGFCFRFVLDEILDYNDANTDCKSHGGTLALVKTKEISDFIIDQLVYVYGDAEKVWIGLNDKTTEGKFVWEDGTVLGDYKNWVTGSGNGTANVQDCTNFDASKNGQWQEDYCADLLWGLFEHERPYICQYKTRPASSSPATV